MDKSKHPASKTTAVFCIWTLKNQRIIGEYFKLYVWFAVIIVFVMTLAGKIPFAAALHIVMIGGFSVIGLMYALIQARKRTLLNIEDPELKEIAHEAMISLITSKPLSKSKIKLLRKHFGFTHCEFGHCIRTDSPRVNTDNNH